MKVYAVDATLSPNFSEKFAAINQRANFSVAAVSESVVKIVERIGIALARFDLKKSNKPILV